MDKQPSFNFGVGKGFDSAGRGGFNSGEKNFFNFGGGGSFDSAGRSGFTVGQSGGFDSAGRSDFTFGQSGSINSGEKSGFNFGGKGISDTGEKVAFSFGNREGSYSGENESFGLHVGRKEDSGSGEKGKWGFSFGEKGSSSSKGKSVFGFGARGSSYSVESRSFSFGVKGGSDTGERRVFDFGARVEEEESDADDDSESDLDNISDDEPEADAEDVFDHMYNTVLNHEYNWSYAGTTLLVYWVSGQDPKVITSVKRHSEQTLIKQLSGMYKKELMRVRIYLNNSPCEYCACKLIDFLTRKRQLQLTIYIASLYKIKRRSCITKGEPHVHGLKTRQSEKNTKGLKKLMDHRRCKVKAFTEKTWKDLLDALDIKCKKFEEVYQTRENDDDRSRKEEDLHIKDDLKHIDEEED
ncbi:uncharacterized protein LOC134262449 [Saccostrea cucullata]|uniref:uncharacterized protein LOC134262449 n=1 Tax=Saccostrea cuccullata TaxID=36930 RepID=UPI002ED66318